MQFKKFKIPALYKQLKEHIHDDVLSEKNVAAKLWAERDLVTLNGHIVSAETVMNKLKYHPELKLEEAVNQKNPLLRLEMSCNSEPLNSRQWQLHFLFVVLIVLLEGTVQGFGVWALLKAVSWICIIWHLLPKNLQGIQNSATSNCPPLKPLFNHDDNSYGVKPLHATYNLILWLIACVAFVFLATVNNGYNSGNIDLGSFGSHWITVIALGVAVIIVVSAIVLGPIYWFGKRMDLLKVQKLADYNDRFGKAVPDSEEQIQIGRKIARLEEQRTWPANDPHFWLALSMTICFTLAPITLTSLGSLDIPHMKKINEYANAHEKLKQLTDWCCSKLYLKEDDLKPNGR